MTLPALGVYAATTAGYFKLAHAYLPRREVLFQGSAIAISGLMQANRPTIQRLAMKEMDRATAQFFLNHPPFLAFIWLFKNGVRRDFFEEFKERMPNDCKVMFHMTWQKLIEYEESQLEVAPLA